MRTSALVLTLILVIAGARAAHAACTPPNLTIVLDRSSSMNGSIGSITKWSAARAAIDRVVSSYEGAIGFGLARFPEPDACGPGRLDIAPALDTRAAILSALTAPPPPFGNYTPLGETLLALADEPAVAAAAGPRYAVVVTDGFQWCSPYDPDLRTLPIDGVEALARAKVTTFVVGFGGGVDVATLDAMAVAGGTARAGCDTGRPCYYQADDAPALLATLMQIAAVASDEVCDGADNDCDGAVDERGCEPVMPAPVDGGLDAEPGLDVPAGGCTCRASSPRDAGGGLLVLLASIAVISRGSRPAARPRSARPVGR